MNNVMVRCRECGKHYFNWKKLNKHLMIGHDYELKVEDAEEGVKTLKQPL